MLVCITSRLVYQSKIMRIITDQDSIEVREHLKINYDFIDSKRSDFGDSLIPCDIEHGDVLLLSAH